MFSFTFNRAVERELPYLRRYARGLTRSPDAADDLTQDCIARALDRRSDWRGGSMRAWLYRIMYSTFIDHTRRMKLRATEPLKEGQEERVAPFMTAEVLDALRAIDRLPAEQRAVLLLVAVEGLSYRETAEIAGIPVGTVMSRLARARMAIAPASPWRQMEDEKGADEPMELRRAK